MRPSPEQERRLQLLRWSIFAVVVLAAIVAFFVVAHQITPLARSVVPQLEQQ